MLPEVEVNNKREMLWAWNIRQDRFLLSDNRFNMLPFRSCIRLVLATLQRVDWKAQTYV